MKNFNDRELKQMNYIFCKEENNDIFDELELDIAGSIDLYDNEIANIIRYIFSIRNNKQHLTKLASAMRYI